MKTKLLQIAISVFAISILIQPFATHAEETNTPDPYADDIYNVCFQNMYNAAGTVGAPDGNFGSYMAKETFVTLDMGEGEEGTGDLTLHYVLLDFGGMYRIRFFDSEMNLLQITSDFFPLGKTLLTIEYASEVPYRYVEVYSVNLNIWKLDAIEAATYIGQDPIDLGTTEQQQEQTQEELEAEAIANDPNAIVRGNLIKLVDDNDPNTTYDTAVYVVGENETRHAFPSESVFFSWYDGFGNVKEIDIEKMASFTLGKNVTVRPGTYLVKLTSDPNVYAVEEGGVLRHVKYESIAKQLYGKSWANRVVDIPDVFFMNYTKGREIDSVVHPSGTYGTNNKEYYYIKNGMQYSISATIREQMGLRTIFSVEIDDDLFILYLDGGDLPLDPAIQYPY
ncbi:MAG: hypothetical protein ABIH21_04775 [Patescibacteria group bacterium]